MGSWTTLNATYHMDLSSKVKNEYVREETEKIQQGITNKIKQIYSNVFKDLENTLDSDCLITWTFNTKEGHEEYYNEHRECWINMIRYPVCVLNISLWNRHGSIQETEKFLKQLHEYFREEMFYIFEPRSSQVYTDQEKNIINGNAFNYKVITGDFDDLG